MLGKRYEDVLRFWLSFHLVNFLTIFGILDRNADDVILLCTQRCNAFSEQKMATHSLARVTIIAI
jgi:hypothetical protein